MLAMYFGDWTYWEEYNPPTSFGPQKVTFDGPNKLILVNYGVTELVFREDIYSAWKQWLKDPHRQNTAFEAAISAVGGDPITGNRNLGTTYFLENGWKIRTWEGNHELTVSGNFFSRDGKSAFVPTVRPWTISVNINTSTLVENILPNTILGPGDVSSIVDGVWKNTVRDGQNALDILANIPDEVWQYIIDDSTDQTAVEKLRRIATKTQDIALRSN